MRALLSGPGVYAWDGQPIHNFASPVHGAYRLAALAPEGAEKQAGRRRGSQA